MKIEDNHVNSDEEMDFMLFTIVYLMLIEDVHMEKLWKEYVEEIKVKRRFFPKSELLEVVKKMVTYATSTIEKGTKLYRARSYRTKFEYAKNELPHIISELKNDYPDISVELEDIQNELLVPLCDFISKDGKTINQRITELKGNKSDFFGFDEKGSDAPIAEYAGDGQANAKHISFLYSAFDVETAIMEITPKLEQPISVAEIEIDRDIKVFDFNSYHEGEEATGLKLASLSKLFSFPNYNDESEYLPTQYLCEYIRELGFEGVCFNSSVNAGHKNLVIFDCDRVTKPYKINGSKVYKVNEQNIKYEQIVPELNNRYEMN